TADLRRRHFIERLFQLSAPEKSKPDDHLAEAIGGVIRGRAADFTILENNGALAVRRLHLENSRPARLAQKRDHVRDWKSRGVAHEHRPRRRSPDAGRRDSKQAE